MLYQSFYNSSILVKIIKFYILFICTIIKFLKVNEHLGKNKFLFFTYYFSES